MARVWWSAGTLPRSQRMNAIAGPRSRCPSRYRKSLTISPSVSRYQSSAARNRVVPSATGTRHTGGEEPPRHRLGRYEETVVAGWHRQPGRLARGVIDVRDELQITG